VSWRSIADRVIAAGLLKKKKKDLRGCVPQGTRLIRSCDLHPDGSVRNMRVLYDFYPGRSADGVSIDSQGNLCASAGLNQLRETAETLDRKAGVYVISPQGTLLKIIPIAIAEDIITNNAFGGPDYEDAVRDRWKELVCSANGDGRPASLTRATSFARLPARNEWSLAQEN
jgi:sugar lactone lactonase YvrE